MTPLKWNKAITASLALGAASGFLAIMLHGTIGTILGVLCAVLLLAALLMSVLFWRCPSCGKSLPYSNSARMKYCPYCAESLEKRPEKKRG